MQDDPETRRLGCDLNPNSGGNTRIHYIIMVNGKILDENT